MNQEIIKKATKHYGYRNQVGICQEECAELIQALSKFLRGQPDYENIAEEIADVEIMLAQMKIVFANEDEVEMWKEFKLLRLEGRINDEILNNDSTKPSVKEELVTDCKGQEQIHDSAISEVQKIREGVRSLYQFP